MNIEEYRIYCLSKKGTTESFPFPKPPNVLVFKVLGKMFTATHIDAFKSIRVKSNPNEIQEFRARFSCLDTQPYMDKNHWNKVVLDHSVSDSIIYNWLDTSYNLVVNNFTKKQSVELKTL